MAGLSFFSGRLSRSANSGVHSSVIHSYCPERRTRQSRGMRPFSRCRRTEAVLFARTTWPSGKRTYQISRALLIDGAWGVARRVFEVYGPKGSFTRPAIWAGAFV